MYRPPENSNRVKTIKNKFENTPNDSKTVLKTPLRKSKTLQNFSIKPNVNVNPEIPQTKVQRYGATSNNNNAYTQNAPLGLSRQLSDPAKRNIRRTPAFRLDRSLLTDKTIDHKNARLLHNRSRYLDGKISKCDNLTLKTNTENKRLPLQKTNGFGQVKSPENVKSNFSDIRSRFNKQNETSVVCKTSVNSKADTVVQNDDQSINHQTKTEQANETVTESVLKFLYAEPLPKSQRSNRGDICNSITATNIIEDVHNCTTLKLSECQATKTSKIENYVHISDDESHYSTKNFKRNGHVYGSLRTKKSLEDVSVLPSETVSSLTDTLKNALKKPLPKGPAPKKPPRTFVHSPNKPEAPSEVAPLNLNKKFTKKLNLELQKNISSTSTKKTKGDPKYMLDKLETALKSKGMLLRKPAKAETTSEEDSDNEKYKFKFLNLRDLPTIPSTVASQTLLNLYSTSPATSPKFNFNCLTSLGCGTSAYEAVKEPNSSFFVNCKKEEPVYAEPFEYQVDVEKRVKNSHDSEGAIDSVEVPSNTKTIRRSLHYASSPVPDVKAENSNNHVSEVKNQDQIPGILESTPPSSATTSDMDSTVSTPSEENKTLISGIKVKDLIKAIEKNSSNKISQIAMFKANLNLSGIKNNCINNHSESHTGNSSIKKVDAQLKSTLDRNFIAASSNLLNTETTSETDLTEEDGENKHETAKFETYVKRVRSKIFSRSQRKKEHLFHCCLLLALDRCTPYVKSKFPEYVQEPYKIAELCFPEVETGPMDSSIEAQCYSLIITNELGERTFGYCRRVLPEASSACLPLAYCILSKHRAPGFYRRVLEALEHRHGFPDKFRGAFLEELYNCKFPLPGETIIIDCAKIISSVGCDRVRHRRVPSENRGEVSDYSTNENYQGAATKLNCDTKRVEGNVTHDSSVEKSNEGKEGDLDLNSYIIVCNNGEYGTLMRGSKENKSSVNILRGSSTIISSTPELSSSILKRSNSTPTLPADLESLPSELVLMRPHDSRHEENDLKLLGETLKMPILQQVFCTLLLERKVILVSGVLSKLSSCIEALQIILYPFSWQHTIIPVLPKSLWEIVDTPTPLLCGVLSAEFVNDYKIENAMVVNLDDGVVLLQVGDEDRILPYCLIETLKDGLSLANKITSNKNGTHNVFLSDAFLRVFVQSCGHYKDHIIDGEFKKPDFIQHSKQKGKRIRQFLKWFTETTMFYNFVEVVLNDSSSLDLFDQRIKIYSSESATEVLNKMKHWTSCKSLVGSNMNRFQ